MLGVFVNAIAVLILGLLGAFVGERFPVRIQESIMKFLPLCVLVMGVESAMKGNIIVSIISLVLGVIVGELLDLDGKLNNFANSIKEKFISVEEDKFTEGFISASLIFCVGSMARLLSPIDKTNDLRSDFQDIIGHRYEKEINQAYGNKRIIGYPDGSFKPDNYITRAEAVIMFNSIFNRVPDKDFINKNEVLLVKFKDLKKDHWAYYELEEAANSHEFNKETNNRYETWIKLI